MRWPRPTPCPTQAHHKNGIGPGLSRPYPHMYPLGRLALSCSTVSLTSDHPGLNRSPQTPVGGGGLTLTPHPRQFFFPWADSMANLFLRRFAAEGFFFLHGSGGTHPGNIKVESFGGGWRVEGGGCGGVGCMQGLHFTPAIPPPRPSCPVLRPPAPHPGHCRPRLAERRGPASYDAPARCVGCPSPPPSRRFRSPLGPRRGFV